MSEEILDSLLKENSRVPRKGSGVGVINVHKRIQIRFGKKYGLEIESEPDEGTMVRIRLPYIEYSPEILEMCIRDSTSLSPTVQLMQQSTT